MADIGHCTRIALELENMSKQDLADRLGVKYGMAAAHCRNVKQSQTSIENLAKAFDMSVSEFLSLPELREKG